ncbi:non-ribosomal peptide synthetase [Streptomyces sp. 796.1]|uniref:non-ribosomal peptide synthetase n=1 Tax=Streptomyces sp. 796.1 TaxID=3163029 RepID=UPI0039C98B52
MTGDLAGEISASAQGRGTAPAPGATTAQTAAPPTTPPAAAPACASAAGPTAATDAFDGAGPAADRLLSDLLTARARRTPDAIAVRCGGRTLTYAELIAAGERLAAELGGGPGQPVAVVVDRSLELVVALVGVVMSGHAFVPIDPSYPPERRRHMLVDSGASVVVTVTRLADRLAAERATAAGGAGAVGRVVCCDAPGPAPARSVHRPAGPDDLAYVMYTSGSTGRPKGVAVDQRCLITGVLAFGAVVRPAGGDVWATMTSASFDPILVDVFLPLVHGATVLLATDDEALDPQALADLFSTGGATIGQATPLVWRALLETGWPGGLRVALSGGEPLSVGLAAELGARCAAVWNVYGPTETTIWSTGHRVGPRDTHTVPVGRPLPGSTLYVLDAALRPLPAGELGEVWIGGDKVARGYHRAPGLTAERFRPNPFGPPGSRLYRTGDLGRTLRDGAVELVGRADHQVKIRGHRVEPGEVEAHLTAHPDVVHAQVGARPGADGPQLVAYVQPAGAPAPDPSSLREHLRAALPDYMVPGVFVEVRQWPRTPNGKIDRAALAALVPVPRPTEPAAAPARTDTPAEPATATPAAGPDGPAPAPDAPASFLVTLWEGLLDGPRPGLDDDLFALGGHSLLVMRTVAAVRKRFGVRLSTVEVMSNPTVRQLADLITAKAAPPAAADDDADAGGGGGAG